MSAEESTSPANENKPPSIKVEDILLERLKNEPEIAPQIAKPILIAIVIGILALGTGIYFFSRSPEKFAENPHQQVDQQASADSAQMYSKRMKLQPIIDSLQGILAINANDDPTRLFLANVYYECELWDKAKPEYESYLGKHPEDVDARVDYAYTISQTTGDYNAAIGEINKALKYEPEHINALFNAGILTIRADLDDKKKAVDDATPYFKRALAAAKKQHNDKMAEQIGKVMAELEKLQAAEGK